MPPLELALYRGRKIRLMDDFRILGQNRGFRAGGAQNFLAYFGMKLFSVRKIGCFCVQKHANSPHLTLVFSPIKTSLIFWPLKKVASPGPDFDQKCVDFTSLPKISVQKVSRNSILNSAFFSNFIRDFSNFKKVHFLTPKMAIFDPLFICYST